MSFFYLSDQNEKLNNNGTMEMGGGDIEPIPAKTQVLAAIDEIKWDSYEGDEYISARWVVLKPDEFKNRRIFQKIRVNEDDAKKRDKAIKMLAAIDHNAKGGLIAKGEKPTDASMQKGLLNKPMILMLQVWAIENKETGDMKKGNWISSVSPRTGTSTQNAVPVVIEKKQKTIEDEADDAFGVDDHLGF